MYFLIELVYITLQPLNYACLGVFQLLLIKGKKRLVSYVSVTAAIIFCSGVAALLVSNGVILISLSNQAYVCNELCPGENSPRFPGITYAFATQTFISRIPGFVVVIVCTMWSCCIFKNAYLGGDDNLNRRMISIPIVMPTLLVLPNILMFTFLVPADRSVRSSGIAYPAYWIIFIRLVFFQFYEFVSGVVYPFVLILLNPQIGKQWKELMSLKCSNQSRVAPET